MDGPLEIEQAPEVVPNAVTNRGLGGYLRDTLVGRHKAVLGSLCHLPKLDTGAQSPREFTLAVTPSLPPRFNACTAIRPSAAQDSPRIAT